MKNINDIHINTLIRRMEYLKGFLKQIAPQLDEADNEIIADLIWALGEDQEDLKALEKEA